MKFLTNVMWFVRKYMKSELPKVRKMIFSDLSKLVVRIYPIEGKKHMKILTTTRLFVRKMLFSYN